MKTFKKAIALLLTMLLVFSVSPVAFAEDAPEVEDENSNAIDINPFDLIGGFFERIGDLLRMVFEFLENMFTGNGNNALEEIK